MGFPIDKDNSRLVSLDSLKTEQKYLKQTIEEYSEDFKTLTARVDNLSFVLEKLNISLTYVVKELSQTMTEFKEFKAHLTNKQIADIKEEHEKELLEAQLTEQSNSKLKLVWTGLGIVLTALIAALAKIFLFRFSGG